MIRAADKSPLPGESQNHSCGMFNAPRHRVARGVIIAAGIGLFSLAGFWLAARNGPGCSAFLSRLFARDLASKSAAEGVANHSGYQAPIQERSAAGAAMDDVPVETLIARFLDRNRPFSERQIDAQRLAGLRTPKALQALIDGFQSEAGENRRFLGQLMGQTHNPIFGKSLMSLLETGDDSDATVAIRGLAAIGGVTNLGKLAVLMNDDGWPDALRTEAAMGLLDSGNDADTASAIKALALIGGDVNTDTLAGIVRDSTRAEDLRLAAALGLGAIGSPRAGDALVAAFMQFSDPDIHAQLLDSLGHFPFPQIENTWKQFLDAPDTPDALRVAAAEALANSSREAVPFLQQLAGSDRDPNVREMAAWALSVQGPEGAIGPALAGMARTEPEADVRRRLYEALLTQAENPAISLLPVIQSETDLAARVAGFNAFGDAVRRDGSSALANEFDNQIVPELTEVALSPGNLNLRMRAVFALRRATTPGALEALAEISKTETQQIAQAALNGLPNPNQKP